MYLQDVWGIDSLKVKYTESGELIRFSWRVLDAAKATPLNDKAVERSCSTRKPGSSWWSPNGEVGKLRQSSTPIEGKSYWMIFSNSGRRVRPGDRVTVQIGQFHADWLVWNSAGGRLPAHKLQDNATDSWKAHLTREW